MTQAGRKAARGKTAGAPSGEGWVNDACKRHELASPNGRVLALVVADGDAPGAVVFAELCSGMPEGSCSALGGPRLLLRGELWYGCRCRTKAVL